jgi:hypothetical protein
MTDELMALGVVFKVNGVPYIIMFKDQDTLLVQRGQRLSVNLEPLDTYTWEGAENMAGLLPLAVVNAPRPPKFASEAEAAEWLDQYPSHV